MLLLKNVFPCVLRDLLYNMVSLKSVKSPFGNSFLHDIIIQLG